MEKPNGAETELLLRATALMPELLSLWEQFRELRRKARTRREAEQFEVRRYSQDGPLEPPQGHGWRALRIVTSDRMTVVVWRRGEEHLPLAPVEQMQGP